MVPKKSACLSARRVNHAQTVVLCERYYVTFPMSVCRLSVVCNVQCGLRLGNSLAAAAPTEFGQVYQPSRVQDFK